MTVAISQGQAASELESGPPSHNADAEAVWPNFFIVGAPKCATTSMDIYLGRHPDIFMCPAKEAHYFARDLYPEPYGCTTDYYLDQFRSAQGASVIGESSVFYMLSRTAPAALHAHDPNAKILVMLRDPIEVIAAHHSQIVYEGLEPEADLAAALAREPARRRERGEAAAGYHHQVLLYRDVVAFADQLARIYAFFPPEQVHVVLYDDLKADVAGVYAGILRFLGVDPTYRPDFTVHNANKRLRSARVGAFLRETPDWVTRMSRVILPDAKLRYRARMALKAMNSRQTRRPELPDDVRRALAEDLAPGIARLETLLGRDLSHWARPEQPV